MCQARRHNTRFQQSLRRQEIISPPSARTDPILYVAGLHLLTAYSLRAERMAMTLGAIMTALIVIPMLAMQQNFNPALGLKERFGFHYWHLAFFDPDEEEIFGTWFSSVFFMMAAVLLVNQASILRAKAGDWHAWWLGLEISVCIMSLDEVAGMHEFANTMMEDTPWTVVGFPILVLIALVYLSFLWHHRWRTGVLFFVARVIYGGGAVGVEHLTDSDANSLHYNM